MAEKDQKDVEIIDKEKGMENNVVDEKMEGKEGKEGEKEDEMKEEVHEKKESTFDRFLGWFRGKQKTQEEEEEKEDDEEDDEGEDDEGEEEEEEEDLFEEEEKTKNKKENKLKENEKEANEFENNKDVKDIKTLKIISAVVESKEGQQVTVDRSLLIIEEEGKGDIKVAPLAQAEDEDIEEADSDSRQSIDRPVSDPRSAVAVESEKETTEKEALSKDNVDAKKEKRKSATVFLNLSRPSFERHLEETSSRKQDKRTTEHDEDVKDKTKLVDAQQAVPKHNKQKSKMEEEIVEKRHEDRTESMQETWKRVEELDPNKTYRVSYTITTTTIEKSGKPEDKDDDDDDDDDERLFGDLLPSSEEPKKTYDGPPPEDLEPEYTYEEAKKDEAGTADIDRIFDMMAKDAPPPEDGDTVETIQRKEKGSQEILETPEDIFRKLHNWDKEPTDWWTSTKKKRDYEEWIKPMKEGTIRRVIIPKVEIPYDACVRFVTDWKYREEWDKTFSEIKILKDSKDSKLIYCPVKKRDLAFETLDRKENDPPNYITTWKREMVDKEGQEIEPSAEDKKQLELITHTCGIILRPSESGEQATYITILCQLEGEVDKALKNTFLAGHPKSWLRNLKKYYKKQQKGAQKKVVYL